MSNAEMRANISYMEKLTPASGRWHQKEHFNPPDTTQKGTRNEEIQY